MECGLGIDTIHFADQGGTLDKLTSGLILHWLSLFPHHFQVRTAERKPFFHSGPTKGTIDRRRSMKTEETNQSRFLTHDPPGTAGRSQGFIQTHTRQVSLINWGLLR